MCCLRHCASASPSRRWLLRCMLTMGSHCRPPARGQPGRVGQERVIQHQVGVSPTHIAPVRSCVPLSRKAWLRVLTQPVPEVLIVNRNRSALARRLDSPYPEKLENPGIETRVIGGGVHREPSASDGSSVRDGSPKQFSERPSLRMFTVDSYIPSAS